MLVHKHRIQCSTSTSSKKEIKGHPGTCVGCPLHKNQESQHGMQFFCTIMRFSTAICRRRAYAFLRTNSDRMLRAGDNQHSGSRMPPFGGSLHPLKRCIRISLKALRRGIISVGSIDVIIIVGPPSPFANNAPNMNSASGFCSTFQCI